MTVIGPISTDDWNTMSLLKGSIEYYKEKRDSRYLRALEKESILYKQYINKYTKGVNKELV